MLYKVYVAWYWYIINLIKHGPISTLWGNQVSEIAFVFLYGYKIVGGSVKKYL